MTHANMDFTHKGQRQRLNITSTNLQSGPK